MAAYKELDVVLLKDGRIVTLLDFLGSGEEFIFEDDTQETFIGNISDIVKKVE